MKKSKRSSPRPSKPTYVFLVDGECETWYLQMLKRNERALQVELRPSIPKKKKLEDQFRAIEELVRQGYSRIFWIIDYDTIRLETNQTPKGQKTAQQKLSEYADRLKKHENVSLLVNNPCLEFWFLLHFDPSQADFATCPKVVQALKVSLPDYAKQRSYFTKQGGDIFLKMRPYLKVAIANAKRLGKFDFNNPSPAAGIFQLFEDEHIKHCLGD
jgi:RloB-like protein